MEDISITFPNFDDIELDDDGTPIGSFRSVESLKQAYDELRSCYTKNAMELARLKKEENVDAPKESDKDSSPDEVDKDNSPTELHIWDKADWSQVLDDFYSQNPSAKDYSGDILALIQQDKDVEKSTTPLLTAWIRVLENRAKLDSDEVIARLATNPKMKERVIQDYLNTVKASKTAPPVIASHEGVGNISTPKRVVSSLDEAFAITKKLFE